MPLILLFVSLTLSAQMNHPTSANFPSPLMTHAQRLLVVTTPAWNAVDGTMQRYEMKAGSWSKVGEPFPVVVGKSGMGWNPTAMSEQEKGEGPLKHEGDGRSPAGVFKVGKVFGFSTTGPTRRSYLPLTAATECVDDVSSDHYAHIVERNSVTKVDWNSSEKMREIDVYKLGMVVEYNLGKTVPGNGSCIFLHIWKGAGRGTAGCTAMDEANLVALVKWIGTRQAVLIQMPATDYRRLRESWGLP